MKIQRLGLIIFLIGVFFLLMHTVLPFLWSVVGIPAPYPLSSNEGFLFYLQGFSPPIGAILLVVGGLLHSDIKETS